MTDFADQTAAGTKHRLQLGQRWQSPTARRLAYLTIFCSTLLALLMTGLQLYVDYKRELSDIDRSVSKLEDSIAPSLAESLWLLDETLIVTQIRGIAQLEGVVFVEVVEDGNSFHVGDASLPKANTHSIQLSRTSVLGTTIPLGTLNVHISDHTVIDRLVERALILLGTNFLKTTIVALVILELYQRLVGRHINSLVSHVESYDIENPSAPLKLGSGTDDPRGDFHILASAINRWNKAHHERLSMLQATNREQAEFSYSVSHDLKSPTNTMRMLIERFEHAGKDEQRELLSNMKTTNHRMAELIEDVLSYSNVVGQDLNLETIPLEPVIDGILADLASEVEASGVEVSYTDLPTIMGDPTQIRILFQNLISNAIKFHSSDTTPFVSISHENTGQKFVITVKDNGIGIPEKHRTKVLGLFKRLHAQSEYAGTGLGLAICQRIVNNHGGSLAIQDNPPRGTAVEITFDARRT